MVLQFEKKNKDFFLYSLNGQSWIIETWQELIDIQTQTMGVDMDGPLWISPLPTIQKHFSAKHFCKYLHFKINYPTRFHNVFLRPKAGARQKTNTCNWPREACKNTTKSASSPPTSRRTTTATFPRVKYEKPRTVFNNGKQVRESKKPFAVIK